MEVIATIRFTTPSLGAVRGPVNKMLRNAEGNVLFLQTWWRAGLGYASQALSRYQNEVTRIQSDPIVEGATTIFKRYYSPTHFQEHEAFDTNAEIRVRFCLPKRVTAEGFHELLSVAGQYVGISPYGFKNDYGRFVVVDVSPVKKG